MDSRIKYRIWFITLNNPQKHFKGKPKEVALKALDLWCGCDRHPNRAGMVTYCISGKGLHHLHMVLEDSRTARFSAIKKIYPDAHLEPLKGSKKQAEDYIQRKGVYAEKDEQVKCTVRTNMRDITDEQGKRNDLQYIAEMIDNGLTPNKSWTLTSDIANTRR